MSVRSPARAGFAPRRDPDPAGGDGFRALSALAISISGVLDPDRLARLARRQLRELVRADDVVIAATEPGGVRVLGSGDAPVVGRAQLTRTLRARGRSLTVVPLPDAEGPGGFIFLLHDAPRPRGADDLLDLAAKIIGPALAAARRHEELVRSARRVHVFAGLSHDLRTPLNSILGFAQLLERSEFGVLNPRQRRYVSHIKESGGHLLDLVNDILDLQRADEGRLPLNIEPVDVRPILQSAVDRVLGVVETRGLELGLQAGDPLLVMADARRLLQVVLNLLGNAAKFTPTGGWIWVAAAADHGGVRISVTDSGIGISRDDQQRIFEDFAQVAAGRQPTEGSGLGLTLVRRFVEAMGGDVTVASEPAAGSTFSVVLPAA